MWSIVFFRTDSWLGGGFKHFLFLPLLGEMIPFDEHIFQMGWNHQLVDFDIYLNKKSSRLVVFYLDAGAILESFLWVQLVWFFRCAVWQVFGEMPGPKSFLERSRAVGQLSVFFVRLKLLDCGCDFLCIKCCHFGYICDLCVSKNDMPVQFLDHCWSKGHIFLHQWSAGFNIIISTFTRSGWDVISGKPS